MNVVLAWSFWQRISGLTVVEGTGMALPDNE
jgi:hypothetical protein